MTKKQQEVLLGGLEILTGLGIALFWALFFCFDLEPQHLPTCYLSFERSFIVPDGLLALLLFTGGGLLAAGNRWGHAISLPCGGGLVYLGAIDSSFNFVNGIYSQGIWQSLQNAAINLWCLSFGLTLIVILCNWVAKLPGERPITNTETTSASG